MSEEIGDWALSVAGGDFNNDGIVDLALGNIDASTVRILLGDGDGTFTATTPVDLGPLEPESAAACIEISGGSRPATSMVTAGRHRRQRPLRKPVFSVLSNADGTFTPQGPFVTGNEGNPITVALGDLNADGKLDTVTADYLADTGTVLSGHGDRHLTAALEVDSGPSPEANTIADIDR